MKRIVVVAFLALSLATPAQAVGPLAAIVISYVKQALKDRIISYAKEKAMGALGESLADMPGASLLGMVPGMGGFAPRPGLSAENKEALTAAGFYDTNAKPLTDAEWAEYEQTVVTMAKAAGEDEVPDVQELRAMLATAPQMNGMIRAQLRQFQEIKAEQARMRAAYAAMGDAERKDVVAELVKSIREQPADEQGQALEVLQSDALGLPEDLKLRLAAALRA